MLYFVVFWHTVNIAVVAAVACFYFNQISVDLNKSESDSERECVCVRLKFIVNSTHDKI